MTTLRGLVVKKPHAIGSKSEHEAVMLQVGEAEYVLRIVGGNPFQDDRLDALVGQTIDAVGTIHNNVFILESAP